MKRTLSVARRPKRAKGEGQIAAKPASFHLPVTGAEVVEERDQNINHPARTMRGTMKAAFTPAPKPCAPGKAARPLLMEQGGFLGCGVNAEGVSQSRLSLKASLAAEGAMI